MVQPKGVGTDTSTMKVNDALFATRQRIHDYCFGQRRTAPSQEVTEGDTAVAERMRCSKCSGPMHYEGYHERNWSYPGGYKYVALAICDRCGRTVRF